MIGYRCDHCGERINMPITDPSDVDQRLLMRITLLTVAGYETHFCSVTCLRSWAEWAGYYRPPADAVVDAEISCGAVSLTDSLCKFPDSHPGEHASHKGEVWADV